MKKNMFAVLILIVSIINLTLSAYMVFTVVPNAKRTDTLITKILQIVDLELESPLPSDINISYSIKDIEKKTLDEFTTNLAIGEDGKTHYAVVNSSLSINKADENYKELGPLVDTMKADITAIIVSNVSRHTYEELSNPEVKDAIKAQVLNDIQTLFDSKMIVDCTITYLIQ